MELKQLNFQTEIYELLLIPHSIYKTNSKWNTDLNVDTQSIKLLEENTRKKHFIVFS